MFETSDEYDFTPSGSSKLASLFDGSALSNDNNTSSNLIYTAPKQPKTKPNEELSEPIKSKIQTTVVVAKVVTLWKLEDRNYKSLAKHGLAVIGSSDLQLFEIISYKEKSNIILRRKINSSCSFFNQKDFFSSFYDNDNQNWLVKFQSVDDQNAFCKEIKSLGANIIDNIDTTSVIKSATDTTESVSKPDILPREGAIFKQECLPRLSQTVEKDAEEVNSDSSGSYRRANILSRMAKMGQQILPNDILKTASTDISDSEVDDTKTNCKVPPRKFKRAVPLEKHIPKEEKLPQPTQQNYLQHHMILPQNNSLNYPIQFPQQNILGTYPQNMVNQFPSNMVSPMLVNQPMPYDGLHQYVVSQNTELKMNLAQISAKLDSVLSIGNKSDVKTDDGSLKSKIKTLELRSENLLTELERYEKKYDDLQKKCRELEEKNSEIEDNKFTIEYLNKQIETLENNLKHAQNKISHHEKVESDLEKYRSDIQEHETTIEVQKSKLKDLEEFYQENKYNANLQSTVDTLNDTVFNLKLKLKDFEEHFLKTEAEKEKRSEEKEKVLNMFSERIKYHMNNMYQSILASFEENHSYSDSQIKSRIAQNLKGTTFALIKEFNEIYKSENENVSTQ